MNTMPRAVLFTLGCRLNAADSALLTDRLERAGYAIVADAPGVVPDLVIVNSCTVTGEAARKSRQLARQLRRRFPAARLVVTGCSAELDPAVWSREATADAVLSNPDKRRIEEFTGVGVADAPREPMVSLEQDRGVFREEATGKFPFRSRAFLKIQEGCENFCTYCIVPYARGPERSRDFDEVLADCRQALAAGLPELVLTGVNTAAYAASGRDLAALVREICRLPGDFRVRLSSTEPHPANRRLLDLIAEEPKVCRFLHLSLQHGADRILRRMNRNYSAAEFAEFAAEARERIPDLALGTDLIVGFPGETEADFEDGRAFVRKLEFANTHLFRYSPRPGTPAAGFPGRVPPEEVRRRYVLLEAEAAAARRAFIERRFGRTFPVIFEEERPDGSRAGWTDNYIQVRMPAAEAELHRIVPVTLSAANCAG